MTTTSFPSHFAADAPAGSDADNVARWERAIQEWTKQLDRSTNMATAAKLRASIKARRADIKRVQARIDARNR